MNRQAIYGFLLGVAVLGAVVIWFQVFVMPADVPPPAATELPSSRTADAEPESTPAPEQDRSAPQAPREEPALEATPPLFGDAADPPATPGKETGGAARPEIEVNEEELRRIQRELREVTQSPGGASPRRVGELIGELRTTLGRDTVGGVDLGLLEETVERADRMERLANEMRSIAENPSKEDQQRIAELMSEMQRLQRELPASAGDLKGDASQ